MIRLTWVGTHVAHTMDEDGERTLCGRELPDRMTEAPSWQRDCRKCSAEAEIDISAAWAAVNAADEEVQALRRRLQIALEEVAA